MKRALFILSLVLLAPLGSHHAMAESDQQAAEPDITVRQEDDRMIREYRVNGELYAIEVVPKVGKPYYLVDSDGDGNFERSNIEGQRIKVPQWVLFKW
ncbi:DUF2782 domain-containing protein [Phytohalomonas tamaricis]|uniref:DUF2782 domain-containing protein n=1 Tax=Phytohalomonas tamaricis TaxID=2081032 RepID=UPI000D0B77C9|nr:DUF2782 domain-containing protein [Phytohalomonas tamaricis]